MITNGALGWGEGTYIWFGQGCAGRDLEIITHTQGSVSENRYLFLGILAQKHQFFTSLNNRPIAIGFCGEKGTHM